MEAYKLFQLASAYGQSLLSYKLNGAPNPFSASFVVSNHCNLQCVYCNCPNLNVPELDLAQIEILFGKLHQMGVRRLGLLGGEPLLRKDIIEIIELGKKRGFSMSINSNLLLYPKYQDQLQDIDYFFTSLDGNAEKHQANRGKQNYERIIDAIRNLVKRGKPVCAICVVTEADFDSADYLLDLAKKEKFKVHFQSECYDHENVLRSAPKGLDQSALKAYWAYLIKKKQEGAPISSSLAYLKYVQSWSNYGQIAVYDKTSTCAAGTGFIFVDSSGVAYPCPYMKGALPGINLLEEDWRQKFDKKTPCTKCIIGPMLEFNLLFEKPAASVTNLVKNLSLTAN